jgi:hypothetical protein
MQSSVRKLRLRFAFMATFAPEVRTLLRIIAVVSLLPASFAVGAQAFATLLYTWTDPSSGSTRYSSMPPTWYRPLVSGSTAAAPSPGPAVRVYYYQRLIDDTALSLAEREALNPRPAQQAKSAAPARR